MIIIKEFIFTLFESCMVPAGYILLNQIVKYIGDSNNRDYIEGLALITGIALTIMLESVLTNQRFLNLMLMGNPNAFWSQCSDLREVPIIFDSAK